MSHQPFAAIILAAGQGTRMRSSRPKVLHALAGRPMIAHVGAAVGALSPGRVVVVTAKGMDQVAAAVPGAIAAVQDPPLGTGHAVLAAKPALQGFDGDVLVLFGDTPLVISATNINAPGARIKSQRSAAAGIKSSLVNILAPSTNGCRRPKGPARFGPRRSCRKAATLRSP